MLSLPSTVAIICSLASAPWFWNLSNYMVFNPIIWYAYDKSHALHAAHVLCMTICITVSDICVLLFSAFRSSLFCTDQAKIQGLAQSSSVGRLQSRPFKRYFLYSWILFSISFLYFSLRRAIYWTLFFFFTLFLVDGTPHGWKQATLWQYCSLFYCVNRSIQTIIFLLNLKPVEK